MLWILCRVTDTESGWFFRCGIWQYSISLSLHRIRSLYVYHIWCCGFCVELLTQNLVVFLRCGIWQYSISVSLHRIRSLYVYHIWCCEFCVELLTQNPFVFLRCGIWQYSISLSLHRIRSLYVYHIWCCGFCIELLSQNPVVLFSCASRRHLWILWILMCIDVNIVEPYSHRKQNNFIKTNCSAPQAKWIQDRWWWCADPALRLPPLHHPPGGRGGHAWLPLQHPGAVEDRTVPWGQNQAAFLPDELLKQC